MLSFDDPSYLATGTPKQRLAFRILNQFNILTILEAFDPLIAGSIPIDVDIENSDLDILCYIKNADDFKNLVELHFSQYDHYTFKLLSHVNPSAALVTFEIDGLPVEIFGHQIPTTDQMAFRHMLTEYSLLQEYGDDLRERVRSLKRSGLKTEPAFAAALNLEGDPYILLLNSVNF